VSADPGWYPDPEAPATGAVRWWDGRQWAGDTPTDRPAFDDDTVAHIVTALFADRVRDDAALALGDAYGHGTSTMLPTEYRSRMAASWRALQSRFPEGDPPCDYRDDHHDLLIVISARRLAVVSMEGDQAMVDADLHERVELVKGKILRTNRVVREGGRLLVPVTPVDRTWIEQFLAGPRVLQGRLEALLARPRPVAGAPEPGWYPDPTGRYHQRLWTGAEWTADAKAMESGKVRQLTDDEFR